MFTNVICPIIVVKVNILALIIHDLLSSDSWAFFATFFMSVYQLQTFVEREMSGELRFIFMFVNGICPIMLV